MGGISYIKLRSFKIVNQDVRAILLLSRLVTNDQACIVTYKILPFNAVHV